MTHVCHHTQGWSTQNSLLLITFHWADSQNNIIFIGSSDMWNMGETVLSRMFSKYMWLQLWFSNLPFYHKMWEHHSSRQECGSIQICTYSNISTHEFIWQGVKYPGSLDVGSQNPAKAEWGWHTNLHPISMLYCYPHLVNNEHPLTYHSLFNSIDSLSDISIHACVHFNASKYVKGLGLKGA